MGFNDGGTSSSSSASRSCSNDLLDKPPADFKAFRRSYLTAFLCGAASDWLKGPYIYRLYESRGFSSEEITLLFAVGYVTSAVFGLLVGIMADAFGRRRMCLCFCLLYFFHCALHASGNFYVLLTARAVSGVATALLFSAFEAWMVAEHVKHFDSGLLAETFAVQTQGNAVVAIASGLVAQAVVMIGGYGAPFLVAMPLLVYCAFEVSGWTENVGTEKRDFAAAAKAVGATMTPQVALVGALQCLFEGAMHVFVFLWTPCLKRDGGSSEVPHGLIFSLYMVCVMIGGSNVAPESKLRPSLGLVYVIGAVCLAIPSLSESFWSNLLAFCGFEWCVGCYFPQIALLRAQYLSERSRGATLTLFRVPFNFVVVIVLIWGRAFPPQMLLRGACGALATGAAAFFCLRSPASRGDEAKSQSSTGVEPRAPPVKDE